MVAQVDCWLTLSKIIIKHLRTFSFTLAQYIYTPTSKGGAFLSKNYIW